MANQLIGPKYQDEIKDVVFDFSEDMSEVDVIAGVVVTITTLKGVDATPDSVRSGGPSITGQQATQRVVDGVRGVRYKIHARAVGVSGTAHVQEVEMDVI